MLLDDKKGVACSKVSSVCRLSVVVSRSVRQAANFA